MAKLQVSKELLSSVLFEGACARIVSVVKESEHEITFELEGPDVPDVEQVRAEVTQHYNSWKFIPVE